MASSINVINIPVSTPSNSWGYRTRIAPLKSDASSILIRPTRGRPGRGVHKAPSSSRFDGMIRARDASVNQGMGDQETAARSVHGSNPGTPSLSVARVSGCDCQPLLKKGARSRSTGTWGPGGLSRPRCHFSGHIAWAVALGAGASCFPWGKSPAFSALGWRSGAGWLAVKPTVR